MNNDKCSMLDESVPAGGFVQFMARALSEIGPTFLSVKIVACAELPGRALEVLSK